MKRIIENLKALGFKDDLGHPLENHVDFARLERLADAIRLDGTDIIGADIGGYVACVLDEKLHVTGPNGLDFTAAPGSLKMRSIGRTSASKE